MSVSGEGRAGGSSPVLESFLKMATSTVYKMAGLGSFQGSRTQKVGGVKQKKKKYSKLCLDYNTGYLENNAQYKG